MYIDDFIWFPDIIEKIVIKHRVSQEEAEEIFFNKPKYRFVEFGHTAGEDVYSASGRTDAGRYLIFPIMACILLMHCGKEPAGVTPPFTA